MADDEAHHRAVQEIVNRQRSLTAPFGVPSAQPGPVPTISRNTSVDTTPRIARPTINDFLARIDRPLKKAIEKAQLAVEQVKRDAARTGQAGNSVARTFEVVRREFDAAVQIVLAQLRRFLTGTDLDRSDLRQLTVQRLMNFVISAKSVIEPDQLKALTRSPGLTRYVNEHLAAFDRDLEFEIGQFDVDLSFPSEPTDQPVQARAPDTTNSGSKEKGHAAPNRDVFVVHGHDELAKTQVALFLERTGLKPVILHEEPNAGRTIIEKFEAHGGSAGFAVVLLTPDDVGGPTRNELRSRARQNVIGEMFWFAGKLGRARVCALKKGDVELPSDFAGVVYTEMDDRGAWKAQLLGELEIAGYTVDWRAR